MCLYSRFRQRQVKDTRSWLSGWQKRPMLLRYMITITITATSIIIIIMKDIPVTFMVNMDIIIMKDITMVKTVIRMKTERIITNRNG